MKTPNTTHTDLWVRGLGNDNEQTTVLRIFEMKTVRKIHGPAKERRRIKGQAIKDTL